VGLSSPAVAERLQRLEQSGTIRGYHADVDPRALGLSLSAIIRVRPSPGQIENVAARARETPSSVVGSPATFSSSTRSGSALKPAYGSDPSWVLYSSK
jgi:DNA-binding Lrp family transcriptional regulator